MKQKDIALIIVLAFISGIISFFVSNMLFASPKNRQQEVAKVDVITSDFPQPDSKYFNKDAIDPTQTIQIGDGSNPNPFNGNQ